ncbi:MAG: alginate export family protein [Verrucomicrobiota bacterium]
MKILVKTRGATLALMAGVLGFSSVAQADTIKEMIDGGKASLNVRTRYEFVDRAGGLSDINGYSVRTRLGLSTAEVEGFKAMLELEDLSFNNDNDRPGLDVPTTEINQAWVSYKGEGFSGKLGNQVYTLDDHRFIGHVGWRQNIQTFDALTSTFDVGDAGKINAAYLSRVNRVNATAQDLDGFLLNGSFKVAEKHTLTGFAYQLEFDNWVNMSTTTFGFRAAGKFGGQQVFDYAFSYASQSDAGDNPMDISLSYIDASIGTSVGGVGLKIGYESMEGDGNWGFTTPLATVHKFAGFADVFAARSIGLADGLPDGLVDTYFSVKYSLPIGNGIPVTAIYHLFEAENEGGDLGDEIDLVATYKLNEYTLLLAKYAYYEAESGNTVGYGGADSSMFSMEANFTF